ncbi:MAG TPA: DUF2306 domain-containing protein [Caulobacteraceae bacterium]|jgi:threonine/homoserine/homoserine lactone efflux protein|nr:DUF2306 domain-containing protein [Caulobacteraceae bacterium]
MKKTGVWPWIVAVLAILIGLFSYRYATAQAWRYAKARDFLRHQRWMTRSYALTFAAVTLRLYVRISAVAHLDFNTA